MTTNNPFDNLYALILAGGKGRRLWPESMVDMPKQFIDFFGTGQTQLQYTYACFRQFLPASHILISTNINYVDIVREQLPEVTDETLLPEPLWRNTGPCAAWGAYRIARRDNDAIMIIAPSDQRVINNEAFVANMAQGTQFVAAHDYLLTLGVTPTRPEPGYGYIQMDEQISEGIYNVRSFTEKPDRDFAQIFIDSGEFLWNTGMLLAKARYLLRCMSEYVSEAFEQLSALPVDHTIDEENKYIAEQFPRYPNITIEAGVIERTPDVKVLRCDFGWADHGTWHGIYEAESTTKDDNVVLNSDVIADNAHNNIVKIPQGHLAVISGLDGYIVVEKGNTLLICPKEDSSALIRKYAVEVEMRDTSTD